MRCSCASIRRQSIVLCKKKDNIKQRREGKEGKRKEKNEKKGKNHQQKDKKEKKRKGCAGGRR